jgi:malonyl-CoA O-methyltransferase
MPPNVIEDQSYLTRQDSHGRRLVVVPSDSIADYERAGYDWLERYYNPQQFFAEVFMLSPLERGERQAYGMRILGVPADDFARALREVKPDVIRAYGGHWPSDLVCRSRVPGIPVIVSVHSTDSAHIHRSLRYADLVICMSRAVAARVEAAGTAPHRIRLLPNRIDTTVFRPIDDASSLHAVGRRFPPGRHILHVGRKTEQKNPDTLIRALSLLPPEYTCVFIGQGDESEYKQLARASGVAARCFWVGAVRNAELPLWYSWCDCMCVPSRWEGFGIVFIEAAACGAAIVTSAIAPVNEYLTHDESACLVQDYENPTALAAAIQRTCEDNGYRKRIGAGAQKVAQRFETRAVDAAEVAIYQEALSLPQPRIGRRLELALWGARNAAWRSIRASVPVPARAALRSVIQMLRNGRTLVTHPSRAIGQSRFFFWASPRWPRVEGTQTLRSEANRVRLSPPARALEWLQSHELPSGGIRVHSKEPDAYPEVSGYLIPTLLAYGERDLAVRLLRWLLSIQRADGSYTSPGGVPHVFDTGQVLRGLLAGRDLVPSTLQAARRAADYLREQMIDGGAAGFGNRYRGEIHEGVHLYVLPPLVQVSEVLGDPSYRTAAERCLEFYLGSPGVLDDGDLTHFLAYRLEALLDLGRSDLVVPVLEKLRQRQQPNGALPGKAGARWVCTPGLAQIAVCWYRLGWCEAADRTLAWLDHHQTRHGGFRGSHGLGATYFPDAELSWGVKFYLDAHRLRAQALLEREANALPSDAVSAEDKRVQSVLACVSPGDRVAVIGCRKGRFLQVIKRVHPDVTLTAIETSPASLAEVPLDVARLQGSTESVPCPDNSFDVVFSVEELELSANPAAAVAELIRITKPGGWMLIIGKPRYRGLPGWTAPPNADEIRRLLRRGCDIVTCDDAGSANHPGEDAGFIWRAQKRSPLTGSEWNRALISAEGQAQVVERVRRNRPSQWGSEILLATGPDDQVLEIGSGTGEISLALATAGRCVSILDLSCESLAFSERCARELGVKLNSVCADATRPLPFRDDQFDCVWSSGLLEHFTSEHRRTMLREWARVTRGHVINLVPNAACLAYRVGKAIQEEAGQWRYGMEVAIASLREDYEAAGLRMTREYSVGARHALEFLPERHPLRRALEAWLPAGAAEPPEDLRQGYLLVAVGVKRVNETTDHKTTDHPTTDPRLAVRGQ